MAHTNLSLPDSQLLTCKRKKRSSSTDVRFMCSHSMAILSLHQTTSHAVCHLHCSQKLQDIINVSISHTRHFLLGGWRNTYYTLTSKLKATGMLPTKKWVLTGKDKSRQKGEETRGGWGGPLALCSASCVCLEPCANKTRYGVKHKFLSEWWP